MSLIEAILGVAVSLFLLFPGVLLLFALFPRRSLMELYFIGNVVGLAIIMLLMRFFPLSWWPVVLGLLYIGTGSAAYISATKSALEKIERVPGGGLLLLLGIAGFVAQLIPIRYGALPPGEQSMYHLVLAMKTLSAGEVPTNWKPFAGISVNYAVGSHLWTALVAKISGISVDYSFRISFVVGAFLTAGLIYLLALEIFAKDKRSSFFASFLWITVSLWGGRYLYMSGQLPQMFGMLLFLTFLVLLLSEESFRGQISMGLLAGGILYCHQNTFLVMIGLAVLLAVMQNKFRGNMGTWTRKIIIALGLAAILALGPFFRGVGMLIYPAGTDIYHFRETFMPLQVLFQTPGLLVTFTGIMGVAILLYQPPTEKQLILVIWVTALVAMLALFGYLYRILSFGYFGGFYAMFTPSALITNLTYPLCLAGGWFIGNKTGFFKFRVYSAVVAMGLFVLFNIIVGIWMIFEKSFTTAKFMSGIWPGIIFPGFMIALWFGEKENRQWIRVSSIIMLTFMLSLAAGIRTTRQVAIIKNLIKPHEMADLQAMKTMIPSDSIVLNHPEINDINIYGWVPYWTWNECTYLVLPSTERRNSRELQYKSKVVQMDILEAQLQGNIQARPVVLLTPPEADYTSWGLKTIYESPLRRIQLYEP